MLLGEFVDVIFVKIAERAFSLRNKYILAYLTEFEKIFIKSFPLRVVVQG